MHEARRDGGGRRKVPTPTPTPTPTALFWILVWEFLTGVISIRNSPSQIPDLNSLEEVYLEI
jgi:hypothetical protein